jgi:hypothetical protein
MYYMYVIVLYLYYLELFLWEIFTTKCRRSWQIKLLSDRRTTIFFRTKCLSDKKYFGQTKPINLSDRMTDRSSDNLAQTGKVRKSCYFVKLFMWKCWERLNLYSLTNVKTEFLNSSFLPLPTKLSQNSSA